jgi:hypothetical protein
MPRDGGASSIGGDRMSEDERLAKIKDLLDSTLAEFELVFKSAGTFDQSKVGKGWTPSSIPVHTYAIEAISLTEATKIAESRKARMFGPVGRLRLRSRRIQMIESPVLVFFPFWRAKGYHECFYFRGKTYKATVPEDVIAIQVGDRLRPLVSETKTRRSYLGRLRTATRRVFLAKSEPRQFTVDGATELAYQFKEGSVLVDGEGRQDISMEYLLEKKPKMHRLEKREAFETEGIAVKFAPLTFTVDSVVGLLHGKVVKPPTVFNKILTNRFEVTELDLLRLPVYVFKYRYLGREKELRIQGVTGESLK